MSSTLWKSLIAAMASIALLATSQYAHADEGQEPQQSDEATLSHLSGTTFITKDIEASIDFYTRYLGYVVRRRRTLDDEASRSVFGVRGDEVLDYAVLVPAEWSVERSDFPGLSFLQVQSGKKSKAKRNPSRRPYFGELVMAFDVTNLENTTAQMNEDGVPVVVPLALSGTGKSLAITVLDPNNIRVQFYQWVKSE